jgi:uncharacterized protein YndB with AHSA1/START domain
MTDDNTPATATRRELDIERTFDAPRELVFQAWSDPQHLARWWGPRDYTTTDWKIDFRVGGKYVYCMRSEDGEQAIWATGVYREIVPPERIVCTDSFADENGNVVPASHYDMEGDFALEMILTITFEELPGGGTKMTLEHAGLPAGDMQEGAGIGWNESFDKLVEALAGDH